MRVFFHFLLAKPTLIFRNSAPNTCPLSNDQITLPQRWWSKGRFLFSGLIVWEELACSKQAGTMFVWQVRVCWLYPTHPGCSALWNAPCLHRGDCWAGGRLLSHKHSWTHGATTSQHHLIRQRDELGRDHLKEGPRESDSLNPYLAPELTFFVSVASE